MAQSNAGLALKYFFGDTIGGIVKFPIWWYTRGLTYALAWVKRSLQGANAYTAVGVWIKNIFVPMYGDASWQGRLISFFMRIVMIVVRGFLFLLWAIAIIALFGVYLATLPLSILGFLYHLGGVIF